MHHVVDQWLLGFEMCAHVEANVGCLDDVILLEKVFTRITPHVNVVRRIPFFKGKNDDGWSLVSRGRCLVLRVWSIKVYGGVDKSVHLA